MRRTMWAAAAAAIVAAATFAPPASAEKVGRVALVVVYGYETPPAAKRRPVYVRDDVVSDAVLETVQDGRLDVRFNDRTQLIVGPASKVKIDRFVYDPDKSAGEVSLNMSKGLMRFVTGRLASKSYKITTPSATLGVRGTDIVVAVDDEGATTVSVLDGGVDITSDGGDTASVDAGTTASTNGGAVSTAATTALPPVATSSFGVRDQSQAENFGPDDSDGGGGGGH